MTNFEKLLKLNINKAIISILYKILLNIEETKTHLIFWHADLDNNPSENQWLKKISQTTHEVVLNTNKTTSH